MSTQFRGIWTMDHDGRRMDLIVSGEPTIDGTIQLNSIEVSENLGLADADLQGFRDSLAAANEHSLSAAGFEGITKTFGLYNVVEEALLEASDTINGNRAKSSEPY